MQNIKLFSKKKLLTALIISCILLIIVMASTLLTTIIITKITPTKAITLGRTGVKASLENISKYINIAVEKAEIFYEQNGGRDLPSIQNLLADGDPSPFVSDLKIGRDYKIGLTFNNVNPDSKNNLDFKSLISVVLRGKKIILIPIHNENDESITGWTCLTNADYDIETTTGIKTREGDISFISLNNNTDNKYLSECVFIYKHWDFYSIYPN